VINPSSYNNGSIKITNPTGSGYTYSINNCTYQSSNTFLGLSAGIYYVTVKNNSGCTSSTIKVVLTKTRGCTSFEEEEYHGCSKITASGYPNPFINTFKINVTTKDVEEPMNIQVYDQVGKLIENIKTEANDYENLILGENYPSGVYILIVNQGSTTNTIRMVKK